jgi:glycosyltransferase involved in cell wall biosynthesis
VTDRPTAVVVATQTTLAEARATVRSLLAVGEVNPLVVDIDGAYRPVGAEETTSYGSVARALRTTDQARDAAVTLETDELTFYAGVMGARASLAGGAPGAVVLAAGVIVFGPVKALLAEARGTTAVLPRVDSAALGHTGLANALVTHAVEFGPVSEPPPSGTLFTRSLVAFGPRAELGVLCRLAGDWRYALSALDSFVATTPSTAVRDSAVLLAPWRGAPDLDIQVSDGTLAIDGRPLTALDLSKFDPAKPWILEPSQLLRPAVLVSEHPALLDVLAAQARERLQEALLADDANDSPRALFDQVLRQEARRASLLRAEVPDLLGTNSAGATRHDVEEWALDLVPATHPRPVARYLAGVRALRGDLRAVFTHVPGVDSRRLAEWALEHGVMVQAFDADLMRRAAEITKSAQPATARKGKRPTGVNLVGYLSAELGLGQSGRLVDQALHAAGEPTSTLDVSRRLPHRQSATYRVSEPHLYDTTVLCVNGAETGEVSKQVGPVARGASRRIGMWYWELEDFPDSHARGFRFVDEVWAATDFIRDAIAAKSPGIPVRTVLPPLPQREGDAPELPSRFGIDPGRPFFLFTFDFMSYAGRKNPHGLVEAYLKAFPEATADGPQLVIKTINGDKKSTEAEQLRLQMAMRDDLILIEEYLPNEERHVLVAHCAAYVSLHKAEGLGLTLAEAMAWGKPVISTRYGGVVQFMNDANSLLVGWKPGFIPERMGPYDKGVRWAEPDLDEAAAMMRLVIEEPAKAAAIGERAASDISMLHNVEVAGARMREALAEGRTEHAARRAEAKAAKSAEKASARAAAASASSAPRPLTRRIASRVRHEMRELYARRRSAS